MSEHDNYADVYKNAAGVGRYDPDYIVKQKMDNYFNPPQYIPDNSPPGTALRFFKVVGGVILFITVVYFLNSVFSKATTQKAQENFEKNYKVTQFVHPSDVRMSLNDIYGVYQGVFANKQIETMLKDCQKAHQCSQDFGNPIPITWLQNYVKTPELSAEFNKATIGYINQKYSNDGSGYTYSFVSGTDPQGNFSYVNKNWTDSTGVIKK